MCVSACVQGQWVGVLGREGVSVELLSQTSCGVTDFLENTKSPFCCCCSPPHLSQSEQKPPVRSWITAASKTIIIFILSTNLQNVNKENLKCVKFTPSLLFSTKRLRGEENSSSQCLLGKKQWWGGAVVSEGHEGMANRGDYTVSQSVSATNNLQLVCCLTQSDNATTHQLTLPADRW